MPPVTSWQLASKLRAQRAVWNATTSFASSPSCTARRIAAGRTVQSTGQGMCTKCASSASGRAARTYARREIEVVVVEEHGCTGPVVQLGNDRLCEQPVHRLVVPPGNVRRVVERRAQAAPPEAVLDEPQHRVRDDVVVAVVRVPDRASTKTTSLAPSAATRRSSSVVAPRSTSRRDARAARAAPSRARRRRVARRARRPHRGRR